MSDSECFRRHSAIVRNLATTASFVLFLVFLPIVGAQEAPERKKVAARGVVFHVPGE